MQKETTRNLLNTVLNSAVASPLEAVQEAP
jgi:hypothetical protein